MKINVQKEGGPIYIYVHIRKEIENPKFDCEPCFSFLSHKEHLRFVSLVLRPILKTLGWPP